MGIITSEIDLFHFVLPLPLFKAKATTVATKITTIITRIKAAKQNRPKSRAKIAIKSSGKTHR